MENNNSSQNQGISNKILYALGSLAALGVGSLIYNLWTKESIDDQIANEEKKPIFKEVQKRKISVDQNLGDDKKVVEPKKEEKKEEIKIEDKILKEKLFIECAKKIINNSFEQLYCYYCVTKENYNKEGKFIGTQKVLDRELGDVQNEMLRRLSWENSNIVPTFRLSPKEYNQYLEEHLTSHKQ